MALHFCYAAFLWSFSHSPERDVSFQVLPLCLIQDFLFPFDKQPGGLARAGSLSKLFSYQAWEEKEREMFCRCLPQTSPLVPYSIFLPSPQRMRYSIVRSKVSVVPILPFVWQQTGALHTFNYTCTYAILNTTCWFKKRFSYDKIFVDWM